MSNSNERGAKDGRASALWGSGRGGSRSSVLWGKGGRSMLVAAMAVALAAPLAATASPGKGKNPAPTQPPVTQPTQTAPAAPSGRAANVPGGKTWVDKGLLKDASSTPNAKVDVIIQSSGGTAGAGNAYKWLSKLAAFQKTSVDTSTQKSLSMIGGIAVTIPAKWLPYLQQVQGLVVTPDSPVKLSGDVTNLASNNLWPYETGNADAWNYEQQYGDGNTPAIALIDSGVQSRDDFGARVIANVNLSTQDGNTSLDDQYGHGTFVAGVAAGSAPDLAGADPVAPIVSIKVMNSEGEAKTSDVIAACQWIIDHKGQYNIKVANFSLHSSYSTNFYRDPLDRAVEALWFDGVTVVAAAGNYGNTDGSASGVLYSPGNDPFVITVGALDINNTVAPSDDSVAPWSAYGSTEDGFYKPEIVAPGRYIVGPTPAGSTLTSEKSQNMVGTDRIQLSGTSFSAPVVSGTVAAMLAAHPNLTPDQIKGILMLSARVVGASSPAAGVGQITASRALSYASGPNANLALDQFVGTDPNGGSLPVFDSSSWAAAAQANPNWNASTYNGQSWNPDDAAWTDASWAEASWAEASWAESSWAEASWAESSWAESSWAESSWAESSWAESSWAEVSWAEVSWAEESSSDLSSEDAAQGDATNGSAGYAATTEQIAAAMTDPNIAIFKLTSSATTDTTGTDTTGTDTTSTTGTDTGSTDAGTTDSGSTDPGTTTGGSGN
jgi:serine protease AprX